MVLKVAIQTSRGGALRSLTRPVVVFKARRASLPRHFAVSLNRTLVVLKGDDDDPERDHAQPGIGP